jgi:hypothetical protein
MGKYPRPNTPHFTRVRVRGLENPYRVSSGHAVKTWELTDFGQRNLLTLIFLWNREHQIRSEGNIGFNYLFLSSCKQLFNIFDIQRDAWSIPDDAERPHGNLGLPNECCHYLMQRFRRVEFMGSMESQLHGRWRVSKKNKTVSQIAARLRAHKDGHLQVRATLLLPMTKSRLIVLTIDIDNLLVDVSAAHMLKWHLAKQHFRKWQRLRFQVQCQTIQ